MGDDFDIPFTPSGNVEHDLRRQRAIKVMKFLDDMGVDPDEGAQVCLYVASMVLVDDAMQTPKPVECRQCMGGRIKRLFACPNCLGAGSVR